MYNVFCECVTEYKDVIEVDGADDVEIFFEAVIDEMLEGGRCVGEAERYDSVFQVTVSGAKSRLRSYFKAIRIRWEPWRRFNFVYHCAFDSRSRVSRISRSGYLFLIVITFNPL